METELEISLKDLLYYVLRRWRALVVWMLVLMVVLDLAGGYRAYTQSVADWEVKNAEYALEQQRIENETVIVGDYSDVKAPLTTRQIEDVDAAFLLYQEYQKRYLAIKKYYDNSVLMKVDTNHVPTFSLRYHVDNHYEIQEPISQKYNNLPDIVASYEKKIKNEEVYSAVVSACGWQRDASYLNELISVSASSALVTIEVVASSEEEARQIGAAIESRLGSITGELRQVYGSFDFEKVGESYTEVIRNDLLSQQVSMIGTIESYKNASTNLKNTMTAEQQAYFAKRIEWELYPGGKPVITGENEANGGTDAAGTENSQIPEVQPAGSKPQYRPISIKFAVLGVLVGLFLGCAYYAVIYLLSTRLRSVSDFQLGYRIHVLGTYRDMKGEGAKKRFGAGIDEWLARIFRKDSCVLGEAESVKRICAEIEIALVKNEWKCIHLTGSLASKAVESLYASIRKQLAGVGTNVTCGDSVIFDTESLEKLTAADAVVLVEQLEKSRYSHIEGELNICRQYKIPVIGTVVVE